MLCPIHTQGMQMSDQGKRTAFLLALLMLCSGNAASQGPLQAGDLATAHGWGKLRLGKARTPGQLTFDLQTVASDHVCHITGLADASTGMALPSDAELAPGCVLQLRAVADGVQVAAQDPAAEAACRYYCGTNGS